MPSPVELILGPARSGKGGRVLDAYREALARHGPGRCLMLVPTAPRRRATESRLLASSPAGVLVGPNVLVLAELGERLLESAGRTVRLIGPLARRHLIRWCLAHLSERDAAVLGKVRDTPGLVEALDRLFDELKRAQVEPDALGRALAGGLRSPRNRLLAVLYAAYQRALRQRDLYDEAGRFWHAADLLAQKEFGPFANLALLVADGFQDFDPAQLDVLESLAGRAERTILTLVYEPDRPKLFGVTQRTLEALRDRFKRRIVETLLEPQPAADRPAGLERVRTRLFRPPCSERYSLLQGPPGAESEALPAADGSIRILRAAGRTREVEEVARQVSDLVREGAAQGSVAILARSLEPYASLVREIFPRYGLPFRMERPRRLAECPIVRAAMALVRPQAEAYAFRAVARLLRSSYFCAEAFGADGETARAAVRLAREANVWKGRDAYFKGLDYLKGCVTRSAEAPDDAGELALTPERKRERLQEIERVRTFLARLFDALALPDRGGRAALADHFRRLLRTARLRETACADANAARRARDLKALAVLEDVLREVAALPDDQIETTREQFLGEVAASLALTLVQAEDPLDAPVVVLDVAQSRALAFDHVFLIGLAEREFPRRGRPHPFFSDAERADLRRRGVALRDATHDAEHEMLLYYLAATRPGRTLTLSYPSLDAEGRPALPSHYLEETAALFAEASGRERLPTIEVGTRDVDLSAERARAERELLTASLWALWGPGETHDADLHLGAVEALLARGEAAEAALAGVAVERERERGEGFGPFDGCLAAPDILEALCRRYPAEAVLSTGRLERFGKCPFTFFAADLLRLEPPKEPSPDLGPLDVGTIYHGLLERFFGAVAASKTFAGRITEETRAAGLGLLGETAEAYFKHLESHGRVGSAALWSVQKRNIVRDLARLVDWHIENLAEWRAAHTEVWFGAPPGVHVRPPGSAEPLAIENPHGLVRLRGRMDRLDRPATGEAGCLVIDYKSGTQAPSKKKMHRGTSFQLPVYLWAAEALLGLRPEKVPMEAFFLPIRALRRSGRLQSLDSKGNVSESFRETLDLARRYVENFIEAMRAGAFPVWPRDRGACRNCNYGEICRYAEWRLRRKWEAHPIGTLVSLAEEENEETDEEDPA